MKQRQIKSSTILGIVASFGMALAAQAETGADLRVMQAVKRGDRAEVKSLLRAHAPVDVASGDGSTALHWAAYNNDVALVKMLVGARANVNATTRIEGLTPLFMACEAGNAGIIATLIANGANPNQANTLGTTPLMVAASSGNAEAVAALLAHGAQVNARESARDQTALMFAANLDRAEAIRVLIAHGADPNATSKVVPATRYDRPRSAAAAAGAADDDAAPADADKPKAQKASTAVQSDAARAVDDDREATRKKRAEGAAQKMGGYAALHYAARQGNIEATRALLDGGANIDELSGSEQVTPLVMAISNGHFDVARVLIERGADVNKANMMGLTPLYAAIDVHWSSRQWSPEPVVTQEKTNHLALMQLLVEHGANVNARLGRFPWFRAMTENRAWTDAAGATAYWRAAWALDVPAMQLLKDAGADLGIPTSNGTTPLMAAAGVGWSANYSTTGPSRMDAVKFVVANGGQATSQDSLGFTALHGAGFSGDLQVIQYLYDLGAKPDVKTKAGDYPADSANGPFEKSLPQPEAVALLEKLGSPNSHNCRSSECVPPVKEEKKPVVAAVARKPAG